MRNKVRSCWHSEEIQPTDVKWKITCSNLHTERFEVILKLPDEEQAHGATKLTKKQSADDPSVDLIRVKNIHSTISMSYPFDVVIACIEHKVSLEAFRAIEAALAALANNMKDYFGG